MVFTIVLQMMFSKKVRRETIAVCRRNHIVDNVQFPLPSNTHSQVETGIRVEGNALLAE